MKYKHHNGSRIYGEEHQKKQIVNQKILNWAQFHLVQMDQKAAKVFGNHGKNKK